MQKTLIIGNLGADPEIRYTAASKAVCTLNIATSESWTDAAGVKQERTEWHKVVFFDRKAEILGEFVRKGMKLFVEGQNRTRKWQDKEGKDRWTTEVIGRDFEFLDPKGAAQTSPPAPAQAAAPAQQTASQPYQEPTKTDGTPGFDDDDIPF